MVFLSDLTPTLTLDVRGKVCPYPTVETLKALDAMEWGGLLEVVSDYMPARSTIPFLCWKERMPWKLLDDGNGVFRVRIKKEPGQSDPPPSWG